MAKERVTVEKDQKWINNILVNDMAFDKERDADGKFVRYDAEGNVVTGQKDEKGKEIGKTRLRKFSYEVDVTRNGVTTREPIKDRVTVTLKRGDRSNHNDGEIKATIPASLVKDYAMLQADLEAAKAEKNEGKARAAQAALDKIDRAKAYRKAHDIPARKDWAVSLPEGKAIPVQVVKAIPGNDKAVEIHYGNTNAQNFKMAVSEKAHVNSFSWTPNGNVKVVELKGRGKEAEAAPELAVEQEKVQKRGKKNTQSM